ncbi:transposase [Streptomyces glaucescens]
MLPEPLRGRKRLDDRKVLNGIVWKFRTGVAWRDVPERHGPWATLHTRFRRWAMDGTFDRMLRAAQRGLRDPALGRPRGGTLITASNSSTASNTSAVMAGRDRPVHRAPSPGGSRCSVSFSPRPWLATVRCEVTATGEV